LYQKIQPAGLGKVGSQYVLVSTQRPLRVNDLDKPGLREAVASNLVAMPGATRPTTDNWPYLYLQRARIPKLHLLTMLMILGTVAVAGRREFNSKGGLDWHFFALAQRFCFWKCRQ